jgi:hypothetical protein
VRRRKGDREVRGGRGRDRDRDGACGHDDDGDDDSVGDGDGGEGRNGLEGGGVDVGRIPNATAGLSSRQAF